jgi:two-component system phosphate regulon sensor histidine kinase PhoR
VFSASRKIEELIAALEEIYGGDLAKKIPVHATGRIGKLAEAVNAAVGRLTHEIAQLKKESAHAQAIFNSMVDGVIVLDKDANVVSINPAIEKMFQVSKKEAAGRFFLEVIRNNDISEIISAVLKKGEFLSRELKLIWPVEKIFQVNASAIFEREAINGCLVVLHDISEIRKLEAVRRDFVANASHELKTPLTNIKGFVETLLEGALEDTEHSRSFLGIIKNHTDRLDHLVNDLLALSSIESGEITLKYTQINVSELTADLLSGFRSQLKKNPIEIKNTIPQQLTVKGDKDRIEQVITNLIDNAIKFNKDKGLITLHGEDLLDTVKFSIEDSGIGIPEKDIPRIFERFYRVDKARSRELGGTGLGLSIVKHIVELHGGRSGVESTEGLGSTFWFELPK